MSEEISLGEIRVRTRFNPSQNGVVYEIKQKTAELINLINSQKYVSEEQERLKSIAITKYEEASMWAVKSATF